MGTRLPAYRDSLVAVYCGDVREVLRELPEASVDCCVTSPPYWGLRDYGIPPQVWGDAADCRHDWAAPSPDAGQDAPTLRSRVRSAESGIGEGGRRCSRCGAWVGHLGLEPTPELFVQHLVEVFAEVRRVLKPSGTAWLNLGDCYNAGTTARRQPSADRVGYWQMAGSIGDRRVKAAGLKPKDLIGIPWRVALALQADGWYLRADIVWAKPNPMPESITDRPIRAHEYVFLLSRSARYFYDDEAIREPSATFVARAPHGWGTAPRPHGSIHHNGPTSDLSPAPDREPLPSRTYPRVRAAIEGDLSLAAPCGRKKRSVWTIPTQPYRGAHFATFPERLVEPCVLAGTSAAGCCRRCGAPWRRVVDVSYRNPGNRSTNGPRSLDRRRETAGFAVRLERVATTAGWEPTCGCGADPVPAVVLDPFAGSGTTLAVAKRLGRAAIGIELNPEYISLLRERCSRAAAPPIEEAG